MIEPKAKEAQWSHGYGEHVHQSFRIFWQKCFLDVRWAGLCADELLSLAVFCLNSVPTSSEVSGLLELHGQTPCLLISLSFAYSPSSDRMAVLSVARAAAESAIPRQLFLEVKRRAIPHQAAYSLVPRTMCLVKRETAKGNDKRPGRTGPYLFLYSDEKTSWDLMDGQPHPFSPSRIHPAFSSDKLAIKQKKALQEGKEKSLTNA